MVDVRPHRMACAAPQKGALDVYLPYLTRTSPELKTNGRPAEALKHSHVDDDVTCTQAVKLRAPTVKLKALLERTDFTTETYLEKESLHQKRNQLWNSGRFSAQNYQWLRAMTFAIEEINQNPELLPNVSLGYWIYDSCVMRQRALQGTIWMITGQPEPIPNYRCRKDPPLAGIVGDAGSSNSILMARLLGLYRVPQFMPLRWLSMIFVLAGRGKARSIMDPVQTLGCYNHGRSLARHVVPPANLDSEKKLNKENLSAASSVCHVLLGKYQIKVTLPSVLSVHLITGPTSDKNSVSSRLCNFYPSMNL
ncbi:hypothetical protein NDU88_000607 [Pleurodeles waltl]|uniref:Receptor ligand binding region domain-containing protein n=1 Tax=Pleurodeles waltl TaxID=8319 RepID=A0AAV7KPU7_PLEWA|nr:hypothetical protein NDU88_000607 [Pleurodeles waltl]